MHRVGLYTDLVEDQKSFEEENFLNFDLLVDEKV